MWLKPLHMQSIFHSRTFRALLTWLMRLMKAYLLQGTAALIWKRIGSGGSVSDVYNRSYNDVSVLGDANYVLTQGDFSEFCRSLLLSGLIKELGL